MQDECDQGCSADIVEMIDTHGMNSDAALPVECGYYFRLPGGTRAYVGRTPQEHDMLRRAMRDDDIILQPRGMDNPVVLCREISWNTDILRAAGILAAFTLNSAADVEITTASGQGEVHVLRGIQPVDTALLEKWRISSY